MRRAAHPYVQAKCTSGRRTQRKTFMRLLTHLLPFVKSTSSVDNVEMIYYYVDNVKDQVTISDDCCTLRRFDGTLSVNS